MEVLDLPIEKVYARAQDRKEFDRVALHELASSIRQHGLVQPITVRPMPDGRFLIVAGERRYRAVQLLGLPTIRGNVMELTDEQHGDVQLVENVNREDLSPFEEAHAYRRRMDELDLDEEAVADRYGVQPGKVHRRLALLELDDRFVKMVKGGDLPVAHAQYMGRLDHNRQQLAFRTFVEAKGLNFDQFTKVVDKLHAEQQQDGMFSADDFLRAPELAAEAKKKGQLIGVELVRFAVDAGSVVEEWRDVLIAAGADEEAVDLIIDRTEHLRATRLKKSERTRKAKGNRASNAGKATGRRRGRRTAA